MTVKRIVLDIDTQSVAKVQKFYLDVFELETVMDQGWIVTLSSGETAPVQISIASQGGSDTEVPHASIEVDDVDGVYERAIGLGHKIEYGLTDEPWGVRRFYLRDPAGKLLNVLSHKSEGDA